MAGSFSPMPAVNTRASIPPSAGRKLGRDAGIDPYRGAVAAGLVESELDALGAGVEDGETACGHGQVSR